MGAFVGADLRSTQRSLHALTPRPVNGLPSHAQSAAIWVRARGVDGCGDAGYTESGVTLFDRFVLVSAPPTHAPCLHCKNTSLVTLA